MFKISKTVELMNDWAKELVDYRRKGKLLELKIEMLGIKKRLKNYENPPTLEELIKAEFLLKELESYDFKEPIFAKLFRKF